MLRNLGSCCHIIWGVNKRKNKSIRTNVRVFCVWFGGWVGGGGGGGWVLRRGMLQDLGSYGWV